MVQSARDSARFAAGLFGRVRRCGAAARVARRCGARSGCTSAQRAGRGRSVLGAGAARVSPALLPKSYHSNIINY